VLPVVPKELQYPKLKYAVVMIIWATWLVVYLITSAIMSRLASHRLRGHPYSEFKFANLLMLWQVCTSNPDLLAYNLGF
jgi:hypothetical protein